MSISSGFGSIWMSCPKNLHKYKKKYANKDLTISAFTVDPEEEITYLLYSLFTHSVWDCILCFVHPIFRFLSLLETKLWKYKIFCNLCLHFARQDGQDRKKGKKITQRKWPKYQKPKDKNMELTWNMYLDFLYMTWPLFLQSYFSFNTQNHKSL